MTIGLVSVTVPPHWFGRVLAFPSHTAHHRAGFHRCRTFGSGDFPKLFADFNATDTVHLIPAVRSPDGSCVDENGCDAELMISCAIYACGASFDEANQCAVDFVDCMDSHTYTTAAKVGATCAAATGLDFAGLEACFGGDDGAGYLSDASIRFNAQYPGSTYIPAIAIDGADLGSPSYASVSAAMCAAGSTADACASAAADASRCAV